MRITTVIGIITILAGAVVSSCGWSGGGSSLIEDVPNLDEPVADVSTTNWGSPGGNAANTRLSDKIGPSAPDLQWANLSENSISSKAVVTDDGTVVVGAGNAVVAFNPDGTVRWRRPAVRRVEDVFCNDSGFVAFHFGYETIHVVSPDGDLLSEVKDLDSRKKIIGLDPNGTLYTWEKYPFHSEPEVLAATSTTGEVLWHKEIGNEITSMKLLTGGIGAIGDYNDTFFMFDSHGQEQWSVTPPDMRMWNFWQTENGGILFCVSQQGTSLTSGYQIYSPTGTLVETQDQPATEVDLIYYRMQGITTDGNTVWLGYQGEIIALDPNGELLWQYDNDWYLAEYYFGVGGEFYCLLFMGGGQEQYRTKLLGFDSTGELFFSNEYGGGVRQTLVSDQSGRMYVGIDQSFVAFNIDAEKAWAYDLGGTVSSIAVGQDGMVYSTAGNILYATTTAGVEHWRYVAQGPLGVVLASQDGSIYTHTGNTILELSNEGGLSQELTFETEEFLHISLGLAGQIFVAGSTGLVRALLPEMLPLWEYQAPASVTTRMAIDEDGSLYFGCAGGMLYALNETGEFLWGFDMQSRDVNTPLVLDGNIFATSVDGGLFKIAHDGTQVWRFQPRGDCNASPAIGPDGTTYFGTDDYYLNGIPFDDYPPRGTSAPDAPGQTTVFGIEADDYNVLFEYDGVAQGLYAVNPDGTLLWNHSSNYPIDQEVAVDASGFIYLSVKGQLFSLKPDGSVRWSKHNFYTANIPPVIATDGSILFGTANMLAAIGPGS